MPDEVRLAGAFVLAFAATHALTPVAIRVACRLHFYDRPAGYKGHAEPTPYLGGLAVLGGFALATLAFGGGHAAYAPILTGACLLWLVGTMDDRRTLPPLQRLGAAAFAGVFLWAAGLGWSVTSLDLVNAALTVLWVVCVVNAFNLMDNTDGAASVVAAVSLGGVALLSVIHGDALLAALGIALSAACLAFLRYNLATPSRIFLGDGGSMVIGFAAAAATMALPPAGPTGWAVLVPATLLVGVPAFDTVLVIVSRYRRRVRIWSGGRDHITYRLRTRLPSVRAVSFFLGVLQAMLCLLAVGLSGVGASASVAAALLFLALAAASLWTLETPAWQPPWNVVPLQLASEAPSATDAGTDLEERATTLVQGLSAESNGGGRTAPANTRAHPHRAAHAE